MNRNHRGTHSYINELMGSAVPPPVRPRCTDGTQGVVRGAHAFVLRISSLFGLAPLRFQSSTNGFTVTLSNGMCIYSYVLVTILGILTVVGFASEINKITELPSHMQSNIFVGVFICDKLIVLVLAGVGVYGAPRRMRKMLKFLGSVASVDKNIGAQYSVVTERKLCCAVLAILISFSILMVYNFSLHSMHAHNITWEFARNYIGFYVLWYVIMILELQFTFTALFVRARFQAVNDALALTAKHVSSPNGGQPCFTVPPCEAIRRLASLHGILCEVVHHINDSYGLSLILILSSVLLNFIVTPYYLILELVFFGNGVYFFVLDFLWCAVHLLRIYVIVEPSYLTIAENKKTKELLCSLLTHAPPTGVLTSRLKQFSRQLTLRSAIYSPLGMCTLKRSLISSIINAVTTYVVVLLQFHRYN